MTVQVVQIGGSGGGASVPNTGFIQYSEVRLSSGNLTTISTAFVDVVGASISLITGPHRCILNIVGVAGIGLYNANVDFDLVIDGVNQGGALGLSFIGGTDVTSSVFNNSSISLSYYTTVLTAAAHTFKVQWKVSASTGVLFADASTVPFTFSVIETGLTT